MTVSKNPTGSITTASTGQASVPVVGANDFAPPATGAAVSTPLASDAVPTTRVVETERPSESEGGGKAKKAALFAAAAGILNKVREEAPKKMREIQDKRAAGRHVILTELDGRPVVVGPFPRGEDARRAAESLDGTPRVIELVPASTCIPVDQSQS